MSIVQARAEYEAVLEDAQRRVQEAKSAYVAALRETQASGVSMAEIAAELGVTRQRVAALLG